MPALEPITPSNSIAITVAATTASVALPTPVGNQVVVSSPSSNAIAFIAFGAAANTVVIPTGTQQNGFPILPGTAQTFTIGNGQTNIATIGTAANTLYVSSGNGQ